MKNWSKLLQIVQKSQEKVIFFDDNSGQAMVIMPFEKYYQTENSVNFDQVKSSAQSELTESELLDKINRDIADWQSQQKEDKEPITVEQIIKAKQEEMGDYLEDEDDQYYIEPVE